MHRRMRRLTLCSLMLFMLYGCVVGLPLTALRTDNSRQGNFTTRHGSNYRWYVTRPEIVALNCLGHRTGCVTVPARYEGDPIRGEIWIVDSRAVELHECLHVKQIDGEGPAPSEGFGWGSVFSFYLQVGHAPAAEQLCAD